MNWSTEMDMNFIAALRWFPESYPNRWEVIAKAIGATVEMVCQRHQELFNEVQQIKSTWVPPPAHPTDSCPSSSTSNERPPKIKSVGPWTLKEHALFLLGVERYGWGKWKDIANKAMMTRDATQVGSHAQKFNVRQNKRETNVKERPSIHDLNLKDFSLDYLNLLLSSHPHLMPHSSCSPMNHYHHQPLPVNQIPLNQQTQFHYDPPPVHHQHDHLLPMKQLATQIPSTLHSHQQAADSQVVWQSSLPPMNQ